MIRTILRSAALLMSAAPGLAMAQQAPWNAKDMPVSHRDRVYASEQFSNTVSVTDPADNRLLGVIKLGDPQPMNFSPLYKGQVLVHGLGFSPDGKTLAVVSIGSNAVSWIDTATNTVKHTTYVGAVRTRRSSRRTERRSGSPFAARTISPCSIPRRTRKPAASRRPVVRV